MILSAGVALCSSSIVNAFITQSPTPSSDDDDLNGADDDTDGGSGSSSEDGVFGDPHFRMWSGELYDFHGVCDLVLLQNVQFDGGLGMDIHVRSKRMLHQYSYVDALAARIGDDTLEVKGGKNGGFWVNGEQGSDIEGAEAVILSGKYSVEIKKVNEKSTQYTIDLGGDEAIVIATWNSMVRLNINYATSEIFGKSVGMMGEFFTGEKLGRDGTTIEDLNEFGQDWQVLETEPKLFHDITDNIQAPSHCEIPSKFEMRRRLIESSITEEEAKLACSGVPSDELNLCIFDVMASNDKDAAGAY